jgi:hypothetical protein
MNAGEGEARVRGCGVLGARPSGHLYLTLRYFAAFALRRAAQPRGEVTVDDSRHAAATHCIMLRSTRIGVRSRLGSSIWRCSHARLRYSYSSRRSSKFEIEDGASLDPWRRRLHALSIRPRPQSVALGTATRGYRSFSGLGTVRCLPRAVGPAPASGLPEVRIRACQWSPRINASPVAQVSQQCGHRRGTQQLTAHELDPAKLNCSPASLQRTCRSATRSVYIPQAVLRVVTLAKRHSQPRIAHVELQGPRT